MSHCKALFALVAAVLLSLPAAAICPGTYSVVNLANGSHTPSSVLSQINAAPAGPVRVQSANSGKNATISGSISPPRACVTFNDLNIAGLFDLGLGDNGSELINSSAAGFNCRAADNWVISGSYLDGHSFGASVVQQTVWDDPPGDGCTGWSILNNTFTRFYGTSCQAHSEALYIGGKSANGLISGNTFTDNGSTAHLFFTWFGNSGTQGYPRDICVVDNVWNATHTHPDGCFAFFDVQFNTDAQGNSTTPLSANVSIDPDQNANTTPTAFVRECGPSGPTLLVDAFVSPSSGTVPATNIDVVLSGTGTATGNVTNARIDCSTSDGLWWVTGGNQATAASCNAAVASGNESSCARASTSGLGSSFSINFNDECNFAASSTITAEATREGITDSGTTAFSATAAQVAVISDDFSSGALANWTQDNFSGSWAVVAQELQGTTVGGDGTAFLRYNAATLNSDDQCGFFRVDNDTQDAPGIFLRGTSTNPASSNTYHFDLALDTCTVPGNCPLQWRSYAGDGQNALEGQITNYSTASLPRYYGACIDGAGMAAVMSVYDLGATLPVADRSTWPAAVGTIAKTNTSIITDTGRSVGFRRYRGSGSGTVQLDDVSFFSAGDAVGISTLTPAAPTTSDPLALTYAWNGFTATSCTTSWSGANTGSRADPAPLGSDILPETLFDTAGATNFQVVCQPGSVTSPVVTRTFTAPTPATMDFTVTPGSISGPSPQTANTAIVITGNATGLVLVEQDRDGNGTFGDQYPDIGPSSGDITYDIPDSPAFADTGTYAIRVTRGGLTVTKVFDVVITGVATLQEVLSVRVENGDRCRPARNAITLAEAPAVTIVDRSDGACPNPVTITNAYPSVGAYTATTGSLDATLTTPTATVAANDDTVPFAALGETGFCGSPISEIVSLAIPTPPTCATAANGLYGFVARGFTGDLVANEPTGTGGAEKTYIWRVGDIALDYSPARPTPNDSLTLTYTVDGFTDVSCLADSNGDGFVDLDVNESTNSVVIPPLPVGTHQLKVVCEGTVSDDVTVIVAPAAPSNVRKLRWLR